MDGKSWPPRVPSPPRSTHPMKRSPARREKDDQECRTRTVSGNVLPFALWGTLEVVWRAVEADYISQFVLIAAARPVIGQEVAGGGRGAPLRATREALEASRKPRRRSRERGCDRAAGLKEMWEGRRLQIRSGPSKERLSHRREHGSMRTLGPREPRQPAGELNPEDAARTRLRVCEILGPYDPVPSVPRVHSFRLRHEGRVARKDRRIAARRGFRRQPTPEENAAHAQHAIIRKKGDSFEEASASR